MKFNFFDLALSSVLLFTTAGCSKTTGNAGCDYAGVDILPSQDLKHVLITASRICGSGMVTISNDVLLLTPSSELNLEDLNDKDWIMIFSRGFVIAKPKLRWVNNNEVEVVLPPSEISPNFPDYPNRMRKSLHGIKVVMKDGK